MVFLSVSAHGRFRDDAERIPQTLHENATGQRPPINCKNPDRRSGRRLPFPALQLRRLRRLRRLLGFPFRKTATQAVASYSWTRKMRLPWIVGGSKVLGVQECRCYA